MITAIAWKNVWRNKLRSFVVILAVASGLLGGVFAMALMNGLVTKKTKASINKEISHIQIHQLKYTEDNDSRYFIKDYDKIRTEIMKIKEVKSITERLKINAMLYNSRGNTEVTLNGIIPEYEKKVTQINETLQDTLGDYFKDNKKKSILISVDLATELRITHFKITEKTLNEYQKYEFPEAFMENIKSLKNILYKNKKKFLDTLITLTSKKFVNDHEYLFKKSASTFKQKAKVFAKFQTPKDSTGNLTQALFKTCGVYKTNNTMFDKTTIFVQGNYLRELANFSKNETHEIAILLNDIAKTDEVTQLLRQKFPDLEIETWKEIQPELAITANMMQLYNYIFIGIILFALAFGIVNTMLMAILERTKELGMLASVGMKKSRIFSMILLETIFLTVTGASAGLFANFFLLAHYSQNGIDFSKYIAEGFEAVGYSAVITPEVSPSLYFGITVLVVVTAILSAIYPAIKAIKLRPAEAVR